jgi:hypothetical protein
MRRKSVKECLVAQATRNEMGLYTARVLNAQGDVVAAMYIGADGFETAINALNWAKQYIADLAAERAESEREALDRRINRNIAAREAQAADAPIDVDFNTAVVTLAREHFPDGWDVAEEAPSTLADLTALLDSGKRMTVYSGASDATIFGPRAYNYAFRAWHDALHYEAQAPFTPEGEAHVASLQKGELLLAFGNNPQTQRWCNLIDAEVNGQLRYAQFHDGQFPRDRRGFVRAYLDNPLAVLSTF